MNFAAAADRYERMPYRRCGRSGLLLPAISLGFWQNFGHERPLETSRAIVRRAFDLGITHFDLANNYGPPYGSAEETFGRLLRDDLRPYRVDPETPLEETMGALATAVHQGKALYVGISSYSAAKTWEAAGILDALRTPLLIHQPSYSILNRWLERDGLLDVLEEAGAGCIGFSPLAQGLLTDRYLDGIPEGSRASRDESFSPDLLTEETIAKVRALNGIAAGRGQSLAQLALAW